MTTQKDIDAWVEHQPGPHLFDIDGNVITGSAEAKAVIVDGVRCLMVNPAIPEGFPHAEIGNDIQIAIPEEIVLKALT